MSGRAVNTVSAASLRRLSTILVTLIAVSAGTAYAGEIPSAGLSQSAADTVSLFSSAPAAEKVTHWDWGFRFRLRETYVVNPFDLSYDDFDDLHFFRFRTQIWGAYIPSESWKVHAMLNNEHRRWFKPEDGPLGEGFTWNEVIFESLYIEGSTLGDTPYGFKAGRQNIFYGEGFICWDGGPLDGSRTAYFNAVLLQGDWGKRRLDLHYISNPEKDEYLPVINSQDRYLIEWDETGAGLYYTDESFDDAKFEAYYFYKNEDDPDRVFPESDIHTIGARATGRSWDALDFSLEAASQIGDRGDASRLAWGGYLWGKYNDPEDAIPLDLGIGGFILSGDKPGTDDYEGWNPVYSRWPKWSELYIYTLVNERGVAYWENISSGWLNVAWNTHQRVQIDYKLYWMWALEQAPHPERPVFGEGNFRGMLSAVRLKWNWTEYVSGHFVWETLMPGDYYAEDSDYSHFLRWELYFRY